MDFKPEKIGLCLQNVDDRIKNENFEVERKKSDANLSFLLERYSLYKTWINAESNQVLTYEKNKEELVRNEKSLISNMELLLKKFDEIKMEKASRINEIERNSEMKKHAMPDKETINKDDSVEKIEKLRHTYEASTDLLQNEQMRSSNLKDKATRLMQEIEDLKHSIEIKEEINRELEIKKKDLEVTCSDLKSKIDETNHRSKSGGNFDHSGTSNPSDEDLSAGLPVGELRINGVEPPSLENGLESLFGEVCAPHEEVEQYYIRRKQEYLATRDDIKRLKKEIEKLDDEECKRKASFLWRQKERAEITKERDILCNEIVGHFDVAIKTIENSVQNLECKSEADIEGLCSNLSQRNYYAKDEISKLEVILKSNEYFGYKISQKKTHLDIDVGTAEKKLRILKELNQTLRKQIADISVETD